MLLSTNNQYINESLFSLFCLGGYLLAVGWRYLFNTTAGSSRLWGLTSRRASYLQRQAQHCALGVVLWSPH
jgi:hypothetical protein